MKQYHRSSPDRSSPPLGGPRPFRLARAAAPAAAILALTAGVALLSRSGGVVRPRSGDDRPPQDAAYHRALRQGLTGDLQGGRQQMLHLARKQRGTNTAAWALYQAGLGARATGDASGAETLFARLRREYPDHPLALRVQPAPPRAWLAAGLTAGHAASCSSAARLGSAPRCPSWCAAAR